MGSSTRAWALATLLLVACGHNDFEENAPVEGPMQVAATATGMTVVRLAWSTSMVAGAVSYQVERRANRAGAFEQLVDVPPQGGDSVVYLDLTVEPETMYGYRVRGIGPSGIRSEPSVVAGVTTPSRPGIIVQVTTLLPAGSTTAVDADGYIARIAGRDTAAGVVSSLAGSHSRTFKPLGPGDYRVVLDGLAAQCSTDQPFDSVRVVDTGIVTLARSEFTVDCRDPSRGDLVAVVHVTNGPTQEPFALRLTGEADDASLPDEQRLVFIDRTIGVAGGATSFPFLRPGNYQVELRDFDSACDLDGDVVVKSRIDALDADTVSFSVSCGGAGPSGDYRPADPSRSFRIRYRWEPAQASVGQQVTLVASADLAPSGFELASLQLLTGFDPALVRADVATFEPGFVSAAQIVPGNIAWLVASNAPSTSTSYPIARFSFTVVGTGSGQVTTHSELQAFDDLRGNSALDQAEVLLDAPLVINGGSGGGGGGGNLPPTAVIDGEATLEGTAGTPITLSAQGSFDPDGTIASYAWTLQGAVPASASGSSTSATWSSAGTYTVQLTIVDNLGAATTITKSIAITGGGSGDAAELRLAFGAPDGGTVPLEVRMVFLRDIAETPGPEAIKTYVIDRIAWDDAVLEFISVEFPGNVSGSAVTNPALPGRVALSGSIVGAAQGGSVPLAVIRMRPRIGGGVTTTTTQVSVLRGSAQNGDFNYVSQTRVIEATGP